MTGCGYFQRYTTCEKTWMRSVPAFAFEGLSFILFRACSARAAVVMADQVSQKPVWSPRAFKVCRRFRPL